MFPLESVRQFIVAFAGLLVIVGIVATIAGAAAGRALSRTSPTGKRIALGLSAVSALALALPFVWLAYVAIRAAMLPYNSEGRYWDGVVVHHSSAPIAYAMLALLFEGACIVLASTAAAIHRSKRRPAFSSQRRIS
jgi:hypothetical protein